MPEIGAAGESVMGGKVREMAGNGGKWVEMAGMDVI
jgi:hypothetical protein